MPVVQEQVLKSRAMQMTEHRLGEPLEDYLRRRYVLEGATLAIIAGELSINVSTASRWLAHLRIEARFPGQRGKPAEAVA